MGCPVVESWARVHRVISRAVAASRVMPKRFRDILLSTHSKTDRLLMFPICAAGSMVRWLGHAGTMLWRRHVIFAPKVPLAVLPMLVATPWVAVPVMLTTWS